MGNVLKINGFHVGPAGARTDGIGDWLRAMDAAGLPFLAYCVDGTASLVDAQGIMERSSVAHNAIFRRATFPHNQGGSDVPDYGLPPGEAARLQWESHVAQWPRELNPHMVWGETVNELRKEVAWADWIGEFCYETGLLALAQGWKWCGPGYAAGTPELGAWETPGMRKFLQLCAAHPQQLAVALHEYSYDVGSILAGEGYLVGRFKMLMAACERMGIAPPSIFFTEWGWEERAIPMPLHKALADIRFANDVYKGYPNIKGAAVWALDAGWGRLADDVNGLMVAMTAMVKNLEAEVPPEDDDVDEQAILLDHKVVVNLVPQDYSAAEVQAVLARTWGGRETVTGSADDAGTLAWLGTTGSYVRVWDPQRWPDPILPWLEERYGVEIQTASLGGPATVPAGGQPGIPRVRREMPLIVDLSVWQGRLLDEHLDTRIADTIDWLQMRDEGGVAGAIVRTSNGLLKDVLYDEWVLQARGVGLPHGNYHFLSPFHDGAKQARFFVDTRTPGLLGDWLDVEPYRGQAPNAAQVRDFLRTYTELTHRKCGVYTNQSTWEHYIRLYEPWVAAHPLWVANHERERGGLAGPVAVPQPWSKADWGRDNTTLKLWQFGAYRVPGFERPIDHNVFHGNRAALAAWLAENGAETPAPNGEEAAAPLLGLHAAADGGDLSRAEVETFDALRPEVIKVLSSTSGQAVTALALAHPQAHWIVRAFLDFGGRDISPGEFFDWTVPDVERAVYALRSAGVGDERIWIELHNEPNLTAEGLGSSWDDGAAFGAWFEDLLDMYREALPGVRYLFPGLSPGGTVLAKRMGDRQFWSGAMAAVEEADGLAVHAYWAPQNGWTVSRSLDEQVGEVAAAWPELDIWVTEASNNKPGATAEAKAQQYVAFWQALARWPNVRGVTFFVASASNEAWGWARGSCETWVEVDMGRLVREEADRRRVFLPVVSG